MKFPENACLIALFLYFIPFKSYLYAFDLFITSLFTSFKPISTILKAQKMCIDAFCQFINAFCQIIDAFFHS